VVYLRAQVVVMRGTTTNMAFTNKAKATYTWSLVGKATSSFTNKAKDTDSWGAEGKTADIYYLLFQNGDYIELMDDDLLITHTLPLEIGTNKAKPTSTWTNKEK